MRYVSLCLLLFLVAFATGCPNQPSKQFANSALVNNINGYLGDVQYRCDCYARKHYLATDGKTCTTSNNPDGPDEAKLIRNQALEKALAVIDDSYTDFINHIESRRSKTDFLLDVLELGAGAATGITKGERPNQILGIAITAFRGGRVSSDINFYKQQTTPILISKMDDNRSKIDAEIQQKKSKRIDEYSMQEAIRDMVAYYNGGTLIRAFTELSKDTAAQAKDSQEKVRRIKGLKSLDSIPPVEIVEPSQQIFAQLRDLDAQLKDAKTKDNAAKRLDLIYRFILSDGGFKATVDRLKSDIDNLAVPRKDVIKAALTKIDAQQSLDSNEAYWYIYAIYNITQDNVEMTKLLRDVFVKIKPE